MAAAAAGVGHGLGQCCHLGMCRCTTLHVLVDVHHTTRVMWCSAGSRWNAALYMLVLGVVQLRIEIRSVEN